MGAWIDMKTGTARNADLLVAARNGDLTATYELAMRLRLGIEGDAWPEAAVELLRAAAHNGHGEAQFELGLMYSAGEGVAADTASAVAWIQRAAQAGVPRALYWLASLYFHGTGVDRDLARAYRLCLSARLAGFADPGGLLAVAAQFLGEKRCLEIAAELGTTPPPVWLADAA